MKKILSLGAGVQSSTILAMSCMGELEKLDAAIFADTGWEPHAVYEWLVFLKGMCEEYGIPISVIQQGNIKQDAYRSQIRPVKGSGIRHASMPLFIKRRWTKQDCSELEDLIKAKGDDEEQAEKYFNILSDVMRYGEHIQRGMIRRQCTYEYKIRPIEKELRRLAGYRRYARIPVGEVETWKGISTDEVQRVSMSRVKWVTFYYPLIDLGMSRADCLAWFEKGGLPRPPRSACIGCPYHDNSEWLHMRDTSPEEWEEAVALDKWLRHRGGMRGEVYLHAKRIPLDEVDLEPKKVNEQLSLFDNDCAGICGV